MQNTHKNVIFLILALVVLAIISLVVGYNKKTSTIPTEEKPAPIIDNQSKPTITTTAEANSVRTVTSTNSNLRSSEYYRHELGSLEIIKEEGWDIIPPENVMTPPGISGVQFAFQRQGSKCTLAYLRTTPQLHELYGQFTFGDRVMAEAGQLDSSWYVHKNFLPEGLVFSDFARIPRDYEARIMNFSEVSDPQFDTIGFFMLYDQSNKTVSDECNDEASAMLVTARVKFEATKLDSTTRGTLFFLSRRGITRLFLTTNQNSPIKLVTEMGDVGDGVDISVYKNKIYMRRDSVLQTFNPFTNLIENLSVIQPPNNESLNTYYISGDIVYYLVGSLNCNDYMAKCTQKLYTYDLQTRQNKFIKADLPVRSISGYNRDRKVLYLYRSEGDAGCFWASSFHYDFTIASTTNHQTYSGCSNEDRVDTDYNQTLEKFREFRALSSQQSTTTNYIAIDSGHIVPPNNSVRLPTWFDQVKYILE